jgi:hypothetical protein
MHNYLTSLLVGLLIFLCPSLTHAERIYTEHDFKTMDKVTELVITNSFTTAKTDLLTYQCTGTDAKFALDHLYKTSFSIRLPKYGSTVTTTKINELEEFLIGVIPADEKRDNIKVKVSKDSITWSDPLTSDNIQYSKGSITVKLPRNNYYVRIYNTNGAKDTSIKSIYYFQDHCNCFIYEP